MKRQPSAATERQKTRYTFTREDCKRGYQAAMQKCSEDWNLAAWFFRRIRGHYRKKEHVS